MADEEKWRLHAIVEGYVQGVGFRAFVVDWAYNLGLTGWVRNRWDDSVEVAAEGRREKLEQLEAALRRGPSMAEVTQVKAEWLAATGEFRDFRTRPSA